MGSSLAQLSSFDTRQRKTDNLFLSSQDFSSTFADKNLPVWEEHHTRIDFQVDHQFFLNFLPLLSEKFQQSFYLRKQTLSSEWDKAKLRLRTLARRHPRNGCDPGAWTSFSSTAHQYHPPVPNSTCWILAPHQWTCNGRHSTNLYHKQLWATLTVRLNSKRN